MSESFEEDRLHKVWTVCNSHHERDDVGCAILVHTADDEEYIVACKYTDPTSTPQNLTKLFPIAAALDHLGLDDCIEIQVPKSDIRTVDLAFRGYLEIPEEVDQIFETQEKNAYCADPEEFSLPHKNLLKDIAFHVRHNSLGCIPELAKKNNIDIRIMPPVVVEASGFDYD